MNLMPLFASWIVLAAAVIVLIVYRRKIAGMEDDYIHVDDAAPAGVVQQQELVAAKLEKIDKWGKLLTVAAVVYGLLIGALFMYREWIVSGTKIQS